MKPFNVPGVITLVFTLFFSSIIQAQTFGTSASAVWISDCNQSDYFNTSGSFGPAGNNFTNTNFGTHTQNSGTLILRGGAVRTFKPAVVGNVCSVSMYYRVYPQNGTAGSFNMIDLPLADNCNTVTNQFPSGGSCTAGDQKWSRVTNDGTTTPYAPVDLTTFAAGNYILEVYYDVKGSSTSTTQCDETYVLNNGGDNYKATFSIQAPVLVSSNPITCNGSEGSITISGLTAGATYASSYTVGGNPVGPNNVVANGSGQINISGLKAGMYLNFELTINGCTTDLNTGVVLSNPVIIPKFNKIAPFCAGTMAPTLANTSLNAISGNWSPAVIDNQTSGSYTFTPNPGQCGLSTTMNVTVNPNVTPNFSFGTSTTICAGSSVPVLPSTSDNGVAGTWSPSVVDNQHTGTYTFTPSTGQCAKNTSFTVTVQPTTTPTFSFGTSLATCAGNSVPVLPNTSGNGITGVWSPSVVNNQSSGTYTFTPDAGQCANTTTFTVTIQPNVVPVFSFGTTLSICAGSTVPTLPVTSDNGITGSWSPASVDNQKSAVYTFTPSAGVCAPPVTFTVTVSPNITPAFSFGTSLATCAGASVPALPNVSDNGITGSWNPATVDNQHSATYTFTPGTGQCATTTTFSVTVNPNIVPTFGFGGSMIICAGSNVPTLPTTSNNDITGTWSPSAVDNQRSGTYTFIPSAGQCAVSTSFTVTVNTNVLPVFSFGSSLSICAGGSVPTLPTTSSNGVTGAWSPAVVDNQHSGSYTFQPAAGQCAATATLSVTVSPNATPVFSFGTSLSICDGGTAPTLPSTSSNGITGVWSPATIDQHNSANYTFTPNPGQCALATGLTVTINPVLTPAFSFGTSMTICAGGVVPSLPATSSNGITGTWSPTTIDPQNSGTYTFIPAAGQCATSTSLTVTVNQNITPAFSFGTTLSICAGGSVPSLPSTSGNGITGTWSSATINNQASGVYTFMPSGGICAPPVSFTVTVTPKATPTFGFGTTMNICAGESVPVLPSVSGNGIPGSWTPSVIDNQNSATYTFIPASGQCATGTTLIVTVNASTEPRFSIGNSLTTCSGNDVPVLATTSQNGIRGIWSPPTIDNLNSSTYTFTPNDGQCASGATFTVIIRPNIIPVFGFGTTLSICVGGNVPSLPATSGNGITGSWSPATVDNQKSGEYIFTPNPVPGQCLTSTKFTVTVSQNVAPTFSFGPTLDICSGSNVPVLPTTSANGIAGVWNPAIIDNHASRTYTFTTNAGVCGVTTFILSVNLISGPTVGSTQDTMVTDGTVIPGNSFTGTPDNVSFIWTNSNTSIGLAASGSGNVPAFTATNKSNDPVKGIITVTPVLNGCVGTAKNYVITVYPQNKDVFVPNVFSPNGDGKNDILFAYSNYISKLEMRIFNQWGQQIEFITDPHKGWDGRYKGVPQPVGVYVYTLKAVMTDGRIIQLTGNITLVR